MSLISRYVLREAAGASLIVLAVLLSILMTDQFADILGDAAADQLPTDAVFAIFGLTFLRFITLLAPIGFFLGVLLALARLSRDSELAALSACGVGPVAMLRPIMLLAVTLAAGVAWLALVETPQATARIEQIRFEARGAFELGALEAGAFTSPDSGRTVVYSREVDGNMLRDVFIEREHEDRVVVVRAERGEQREDPATGRLSFVLYNGMRYEGRPGEAQFSIAEFAEHGIPVQVERDEPYVEPVETLPTTSLMRSPAPEHRAELQWRLSAPVSLVVLALLAVPLSRTTPREGRYARVGVGLLLYITYANLLSMARVWLERGLVPEALGVWWVHALFAALALLMLAREAGLFTRAVRVEEAAA